MTITLDTTILGNEAAQYDEQTLEDRGRGMSIKWTSENVNEELILFGYAVRYYPSEGEAKETP